MNERGYIDQPLHKTATPTFAGVKVTGTPSANEDVATKSYVDGRFADGGAQPWEVSWGTMGYAQVTANQTGITTVTDLTSLSITFTAVAGRRYRISGEAYCYSTVANDLAALVIADGSNNQLQSGQVGPLSTTQAYKTTASAVVTPSAGSTTYKLRLVRSAGTGNVAIQAGATLPSFILVEDIGPSS